MNEFDIYEKTGFDSFAGDWQQYVLVSSGKRVAHFWTWSDSSVVHEWDPIMDGAAGADWAKERPRGFRKMRPSLRRDQTLDWAIDLYRDL